MVQMSALRRAMSCREKQLIEVQTQRQVTLKKTAESTELLRKVTGERGDDVAQERFQNIQDQQASAEDNLRSKDEEVIEELEHDDKTKRGQIVSLGKATNELQGPAWIVRRSGGFE
ncbi:hypothetical protein JTB14_015480 [Gonioctena quinquepunctata]|nr:hypothetical protein JTB14_015480 [Gonioctena quinquepunctata]